MDWKEQSWLFVKVGAVAVVGWLSTLWVSFPIAVKVLLGLMVVDTVLGHINARLNKNTPDYDSNFAFLGGLKKVAILVYIGTCFILEGYLPTNYLFTMSAIGYNLYLEVISVRKQFSFLGIATPQLDQAITAIQSTSQGVNFVGKSDYVSNPPVISNMAPLISPGKNDNP